MLFLSVVAPPMALLPSSAGKGLVRAGEVEPSRLGASLERARNHLDLLAEREARIEFFIELAGRWAEVNPAQAEAVLRRTWTDLPAFEDEEARTAAFRLISEARDGGPREKKAALELAERLLAKTNPTWTLIRLAETWGRLNPERAEKVIIQALGLARREGTGRKRDLALRALALVAGGWNRRLAEDITAAITLPEIKTWAFSGLGTRLAGIDPEAGLRYFGRAFESSVSNPDPYAGALGVARAAAALSGLDRRAADAAFKEAVKLAGRIKDGRRFAQALTEVALAWGKTDQNQALAVTELIPADYPELRFEVLIGLAGEKIDADRKKVLIEAAGREATALPLEEDRRRAAGRLLVLTAALDLDRAWEGINRLAAPGSARSEELLAEAVRVVLADDPERAVRTLGRTGGNRVLNRVLIKLAERDCPRAAAWLAGREEEHTGRQSDQEKLESASRLAACAADQALTLAAGIRDPDKRARAYASIGRELSRLGRRAAAGKAWHQALATAEEMPGAKLEKARTLKELAWIWSAVAPETAEDVYKKAYQLVAD
ncbi:MAG: hypothetical protein AB1641_26400 [Thermodesulfobacteriota bacterium]